MIPVQEADGKCESKTVDLTKNTSAEIALA